MILLKLGVVISLSLFLLSTNASAQEPRPTPELGWKKDQLIPDQVLPDLEGKLHRFSDYRGKKLLLIHFASW